jgi:hypothetical protein
MGEEGGWEAWLEATQDARIGSVDNRIVDTYLVWAFYLLAGAYYFVTSYIAFMYARDAYGGVIEWIILGVHIVIGIVMGIIVTLRVPTRTTTPMERKLAPAPAASGRAASGPTAAGPAGTDSAASTTGIDVRVNTDDAEAVAVLRDKDEQVST